MLKSPNTSPNPAPPSMTRVMRLLIAGAALALVIGGILLCLMNGQIADLQKTASDKEAKVGNNEQIARRFEETQATFDATQARARFLEASVTAKSYVPTMLLQLQGLASFTHLIVNAVRPGPITVPVAAVKPAAPSTDSSAPAEPVKAAPPPPYDTLTIDVDVTGSYANTVAFLYGLTRFPKIVSVTGVQIKPGTADPTAPQGAPSATVSTSLHLTAFVFHDQTGAQPAPNGVSAGMGLAAVHLPPRPNVPGTGDTAEAAGHAAAHAIGASKAAQARSEVGITTM